MNPRLKSLRLLQVDASLRPWAKVAGTIQPRRGWIKNIREALGMSRAQLGRRLGTSRQAVADLERREAGKAVTLATLATAAAALDAVLVYAIVPRESLAATIRAQARMATGREHARIVHTMRLEGMVVSREESDRQRAEHEEELLRTWSRRLWDR